ncbi:thioredoxin [Rhodococcus sp. Eu-32]|uniref:thioredoxin family protein n=1 Tax=Rhodococcus sp. Eu-32 TaxID=1017319 RepID=UPI000DF28608|nr:thioredoxin family protein [Rhodococcus sp. Eu-32]RRQ28990.1 thioredoxin [Rhodococcus sp. Eu-32]
MSDGTIIEATDTTFQGEVDAADFALVDFWAPWCTNCRQVKPLLETVAQQHPSVHVMTLDIEANPEVQTNCRVMTLPTVVMFRNGVETTRFTGFDAVRTMLRNLPEHVDMAR